MIKKISVFLCMSTLVIPITMTASTFVGDVECISARREGPNQENSSTTIISEAFKQYEEAFTKYAEAFKLSFEQDELYLENAHLLQHAHGMVCDNQRTDNLMTLFVNFADSVNSKEMPKFVERLIIDVRKNNHLACNVSTAAGIIYLPLLALQKVQSLVSTGDAGNVNFKDALIRTGQTYQGSRFKPYSETEEYRRIREKAGKIMKEMLPVDQMRCLDCNPISPSSTRS